MPLTRLISYFGEGKCKWQVCKWDKLQLKWHTNHLKLKKITKYYTADYVITCQMANLQLAIFYSSSHPSDSTAEFNAKLRLNCVQIPKKIADNNRKSNACEHSYRNHREQKKSHSRIWRHSHTCLCKTKYYHSSCMM